MPSAPTILKFLTKFAVGGTERQFVYLANGIDKSRFNLRVGCLSREGEFLKDIEALNIPISEYPITSLYSLVRSVANGASRKTCAASAFNWFTLTAFIQTYSVFPQRVLPDASQLPR